MNYTPTPHFYSQFSSTYHQFLPNFVFQHALHHTFYLFRCSFTPCFFHFSTIPRHSSTGVISHALSHENDRFNPPIFIHFPYTLTMFMFFIYPLHFHSQLHHFVAINPTSLHHSHMFSHSSTLFFTPELMELSIPTHLHPHLYMTLYTTV